MSTDTDSISFAVPWTTQKAKKRKAFLTADRPNCVPAPQGALSSAPRGSQVVLLGLSSSPAGFVPLRLVREGIRIMPSMIYDHPADFARSIAPFSGSSAVFIRELGNFAIREKPGGRSLLSTCVREDIPIFIPALADSSIGIGLVMARRDGVSVNVDQLADADEITAIVEASPKTGVIYIGGGVPKNFIQQTQVIASIHNSGLEGHAYAIQYTTDAPHFGGLSGCTFEEAISWGKEAPQSPRVQVFCDATIGLRLVTSALVTRDLKRAQP